MHTRPHDEKMPVSSGQGGLSRFQHVESGEGSDHHPGARPGPVPGGVSVVPSQHPSSLSIHRSQVQEVAAHRTA
jgi:hypothetical protein